MRKIFKILLYSVLCFLLVGVLSFFYLKSDFNNSFNKTELKTLKVNIKNSKELPDKFVSTFKQIYPFTSTMGVLSDKLLKNKNNYNCPCLDIARYSWNLTLQNNKITGNSYVLALKIEEEISQRACLNYLASRYDFLYNTRGIHQASLFYFKTELDSLNTEQYAILSLMMENPSVFNPKRNPQKLKEILKKKNLLIID
ncbi:MAG: transglycosylase domain-containing protein [Flavobacteriales bacterium]|nr:transglycosylase domain-containing protein [Flavobacteriales bacterium]